MHGNNIGRGYWGQPEETRQTFGARLRSPARRGSHAEGSPPRAPGCAPADLGVYLDGELYVTGRLADLVTVDGRNHYPQDIEATVADASPIVRRGYVAAFSVPADGSAEQQRLVIIAERAAGTSRADPQPRSRRSGRRYPTATGCRSSDVRFLPAGAIPRTTSGKLARRACRTEYLSGAYHSAT